MILPLTKLSLVGLLLFSFAATASDYFPERFDWERIQPAAAGFDRERLPQAVELARSKAVTEPSDLHQVLLDTYTSREPDYQVLNICQSMNSLVTGKLHG